MRDVTLCLLIDEKAGKITLGMKKKGFGAGKLNGFGGKPEPEDKDLPDTAIRELLEESEVRAQREHLKEVAVLEFHFPAKPEWSQRMTAYKVLQWEGTPRETKEMRPEEYSLEQPPYHLMWEADQHWMPRVLAGNHVKATFVYTEEHKLILPIKNFEERPLR